MAILANRCGAHHGPGGGQGGSGARGNDDNIFKKKSKPSFSSKTKPCLESKDLDTYSFVISQPLYVTTTVYNKLLNTFLQVSLVNVEDRGHFVIRSFVLTDPESGDKRKVKQYHYLNWPDFDVPRNPKQFLEFVAAVRESGCFLEGSGPPVGKSTVLVWRVQGVPKNGSFFRGSSIINYDWFWMLKGLLLTKVKSRRAFFPVHTVIHI